MSGVNAEQIAIVQRSINNGNYEEAVDAVNIILSSASQPGNSWQHHEDARIFTILL